MSRTLFHGPKGVRAIEVWLYIFFSPLLKAAFGSFFVWNSSILTCLQNYIKIFRMVEDLRRFPYFCFGVSSVKEIMAFDKHIGYILSVSVTTDRRMHKVIIGHSSKVSLSIGRLFYRSCNISANTVLSLSRIPRDYLKHFEISVPRHIRFAELRTK